ncbi:MAG TPA: methionine ABC transporter ATP-binding protein [Firmicutes bacterium]|nr:methionine ABC transporter ATP-binding protein [Bacillota bacterium]
MIQLCDLKKTFVIKSGRVEALKGVTLHIKAGQIFGIIGYSGAGKSTLLRCINLLERPTSGTVTVNGKDLTVLTPKELCQSREKIGMIFQNFNLMRSRNVFQNVAYPLKGKGLTKVQQEAKVLKLLELVGIREKVQAYPAQLSGGQKQRVAIARALANDPEVLLCDEATSALDPQTTQSILRLLEDINRKLRITIVIITHEMHVVKEICQQVAVMDAGIIVEEGEVRSVFAHPQAQVTKDFIATVFQRDRTEKLVAGKEFGQSVNENDVLARISFSDSGSSDAFISIIARLFKIDTAILFGNIELIQGMPVGNLVVKLSGVPENIAKAIAYLAKQEIPVEVLQDAGNIQNMDAQCHQFVS